MKIRRKKEINNENLTEKDKKNKDESHPCFPNQNLTYSMKKLYVKSMLQK
jgi:hypothetical protein